MNAHPFAQIAVRIEHRHRANVETPPLAVGAQDAMFENEHLARCDRFIPGVDRGLGIVGMDSLSPAIALIGLLALPGQLGPARLETAHFSVRAVGPQIAVDGCDRSLEPFIAGFERNLAIAAFAQVQHRADHPGRPA